MSTPMNRWTALLWIAAAELFALSVWFSASAVLPAIEASWHIASAWGAWMTASVQLGFVVGASASATWALADRIHPRRLFALSALLACITNGILIYIDSPVVGVILRFLTGIALAGVYPVAVKLLSQWFPNKRATGIGILIAALTLGSALPHVLTAFTASMHWQLVIVISSTLAVCAAVIVTFLLPDAPDSAKHSATVSWHLVSAVLSNRPVMLANYGYFGHMWELYAMWTWVPAFLASSFSVSLAGQTLQHTSTLVAFAAIGIAGAIGCVAGGIIAEHIGKARLTMLAMFMSGICSLAIGFTYQGPLWITFVVACLWGISVIADSAQFSAAVTEYASVEYVGTALTIQMAIGFFITILSINLIPLLESIVGWRFVFASLSIGPLLGIIAMSRLRRVEVIPVQDV